MAEDTNKTTSVETKMSVSVKKEIPDNFSSSQQKIENDTFYHPRNQDKTLKNKNGSVTVKENGEVAISSGKSSHLKMLPGGHIYSESYQKENKTNIYRLEADDIIINNHKLNNKLYELADFKNVLNGYDTTPRIAGGLTMLGTVLVKTWEPNLKRYVLMRRQVNIPMFSPSIGGAEVEPGLKVTPSTNTIKEMVDKINMTGITSYAQLATVLQEKRKAAILQQEKTTAEANKKKAEENAAKKPVSMTKLTGQDPTQFGSSVVSQNFNISPQNIADQAKLKGDEAKMRKDDDTTPGWDEANNRPKSTTAIWYNVKCREHKFYVMQGHTVLESLPCNYSSYGTVTNKISGDQKTPLGVFTLTDITKNNMVSGDALDTGCKLPKTPGTFGPYWIPLSVGFGIGIHGDFPSEDSKNILTVDTPRGQEPKPGEGSTHGCIRLKNADVTTLATKYAKAGQYIKIEA